MTNKKLLLFALLSFVALASIVLVPHSTTIPTSKARSLSFGGGNSTSNTPSTATLEIIGVPAGAALPIRYSPNYTTTNYYTTGWTSYITLNGISSPTTLQYQGAGTTISLNGNVYTYNATHSTLGLDGTIYPANTYVWAFTLYFSPQQWNATQAAELESIGVPANSPIIISLLKNVANTTTYGTAIKGSVLPAGSTDNYASYNSSTDALSFVSTTVNKNPSYISITVSCSLGTWTFSSPGTYQLPLAVYNGHFGINGPTSTSCTATLSSALIGSQTVSYNAEVKSGSTTYVLQTGDVTNSYSDTQAFTYVAGTALNITLDGNGNANYSADDPHVDPPANIVYYSALTFNDPSASAITANTQLMVPYNALAFPTTSAPYANSDCQNLEIFNGVSGAVGNSWLEGNTLNEFQTKGLCSTSANTLIWLYNPDTFTGNDVNWYIGWAANTVNLLTTTTGMGAAPQLFNTSGAPQTAYGQYDNGNVVFNFYANFSGNTLSTRFVTGGTGNVIVANSLLVPIGSGLASSNFVPQIYGANNIFSFVFGNTIEMLGNVPVSGLSGGNNQGYIGITDKTHLVYSSAGIGIDGFSGSPHAGYEWITPGPVLGANTFTITNQSVFSMVLNNSGINNIYIYQNYVFKVTSGTSNYPTSTPLVPMVAVGQSGKAVGPIYWWRVRQNPPNGIQPTVSFGVVTQASTANTLVATPNPQTMSNATIDIGQTSVANTIISNGQSGVTYYTGNWLWADTGNAITGSSNTTLQNLPSTNSLALTINAFQSNSLLLTFNGVSYYANTLTKTVYGLWTFNAFAGDSNANDLSPSPHLTNTITINPRLTASAPTGSATMDVGQSSSINANPGGGTPSYSYNWYTASTCTGGSLGTATPLSYAFGYGANTVYYKVTDSASTHETACSSGFTVTASNALGTPSITPSTTQNIDVGQSVTFNTIWSGGTSSFTANLYVAQGSTCTNSNTLVQSASGITSPQSETFSANYPMSTSWFCIYVSDSSGAGSQTTNSAIVKVVVSSTPTVTLSTANAVVDSGQTFTLTATVTNGGSPFTFKYYNRSSSTLMATHSSATSPDSLVVTSAGTGTFSYNVVITDTASSTANSVTVNIIIYSALAANAITPASPTIDSTQPITLTSHAGGGTGSYSYKWYNNIACLGANVIAGHTLSTYAPSPSTTTSYAYNVTDTANVPSHACAGTTVTTNTILGVPSIAPAAASNQAVGNIITFSTNVTGGVNPLTYNFLVVNSISGYVFGSQVGSSNTYSFTVPSIALGNQIVANVIVTDSSAAGSETTNSVFSGIQTIISSYNSPTIGTPSPLTQSVEQTQTATITNTGLSGGTAPYTYQWFASNTATNPLTENALTASIANTLLGTGTSSGEAQSANAAFATTNSIGTGTYLFALAGTDAYPTTVNTITVNVIVTAYVTPPSTSCGKIPSGAIGCIPFTIRNTQGSAMSIGTQVLVAFNASLYSTHLASNLENVECYNATTGALLNCWLEGNVLNELQTKNLNTANVIYWIKLDTPLASSATDNNIYFAIFPVSSDLYTNGAGTGAAPQLFNTSGAPQTSYGQYDNGNKVFNLYNNFNGSSLSSLWTSSGNVLVSNGLVIKGYAQSQGIYSKTTYNLQGNTLDSLTSVNNTGIVASRVLAISTASGINVAPITGDIEEGGNGNAYWYGHVYNSIDETVGPFATAVNNFTVVASIYQLSSTSSTYFTASNYTGYQGISLQYTSAAAAYLELEASWYTGSTNVNTHTSWMRLRTTPPNGVQPAITFGSFLSVLPFNIYLRNSTANPAVTFPSFAGLPACTANYLSGFCVGTDVISGTQTLTGTLTVLGGVTINAGATLITNGYSILASGTFDNLGTVVAGQAFAGVAGGAAGTVGNTGISVPNSYGGSGGGGGGAVSQSSAATAGKSPIAPALSTALIQSWSANGLQTYLEGAGGGSGAGSGSAGGTGGGGTYGIYIQASNIIAGVIQANGIAGGAAQGIGGGGGGGSGGGVILLAYGSGGYTAGTYTVTGGTGGNAGGGSYSGSAENGGNGGNTIAVRGMGGISSGGTNTGGNGATGGSGNVLTYSYTTPPIQVAPLQYYPIQIYTVATPTISFTLNVISPANVLTNIATSVPSFSYVPPANQVSGIYRFNVTATNTISSLMASYVFNISLNMTDITAQGCTSPVIQYFPNICKLSFTATPSTYKWLSDNPLNQHNANTTAGAIWSNANLTFVPQVTLSYNSPAWATFIANITDNPAMASITQNALVFTVSNTVPASPNTRELMNVSLWDQQSLALIPASLSPSLAIAFTPLFNNYILASPLLNSTINLTQVYMPYSNFQNPPISLTNISIKGAAISHYPTVGDFMSTLLTSSQHSTYKLYLANLNASFYTFQIYQGSGYGALNYTMVVQEGTSPSSAITVQSYKITAVPFALPLQNGEQYRFLFYNTTGSLVYTSALSIWPQTITIYLPTISSIPSVSVPSFNVTCVTTTNAITGNKLITSHFQDTRGIVTSWNISLLWVSILEPFTINTVIVNSSSGSVTFQIPNKTKSYYVASTARYGNTTLTAASCTANQYAPSIPAASYGLMAFFLFMVMVFAAGGDLRLSIVMAVITLVFEAYIGLSTLLIGSILALAFISGIVIFWARTRHGE